MLLRIATEADIPVICRLFEQNSSAYVGPHPDFFLDGKVDTMLGLLSQGRVLMEDEGKGMVGVMVFDDWYYLVATTVDASERGNGLGGKLLDAAKELGMSLGAKRGLAAVANDLVPFYGKHGFSPIAVVMQNE
jgi:GNAT superfamily N-acetyltransferase